MKKKMKRRGRGEKERVGGIERQTLSRQREDREYSTHKDMRTSHPPLSREGKRWKSCEREREQGREREGRRERKRDGK